MVGITEGAILCRGRSTGVTPSIKLWLDERVAVIAMLGGVATTQPRTAAPIVPPVVDGNRPCSSQLSSDRLSPPLTINLVETVHRKITPARKRTPHEDRCHRFVPIGIAYTYTGG